MAEILEASQAEVVGTKGKLTNASVRSEDLTLIIKFDDSGGALRIQYGAGSDYHVSGHLVIGGISLGRYDSIILNWRK